MDRPLALRAPATAVLVLILSALLLPTAPTVAQSGDPTRPALPSPGCGSVAADAVTSPFLQVGDDSRQVRSHVPPAHDGSTPLPLIIWLHGQGMSASGLAGVTALPAFGEANGIIVVAPQGHRPDSGWMWEPGAAGVEPGLENRDVAVIDALIDQLGSELCLDLARVSAGGYSIGGHGATTLGCRLSDRIAAVVATAGFTDLGSECDASRVVPTLVMAGTDDEYIRFGGGLGDFLSDRLPWGTTKGEEPFFNRTEWSLPPVERMAAVARRNGCEPEPAAEELAGSVLRLTWACPEGSDHELITVDGGGHDWLIERGGLDANELYWEFLSRFSLPD